MPARGVYLIEMRICPTWRDDPGFQCAGGLGEDSYTERPDFICRHKVIHHPGMVRSSGPEGPATLAGRDDAVGYC